MRRFSKRKWNTLYNIRFVNSCDCILSYHALCFQLYLFPIYIFTILFESFGPFLISSADSYSSRAAVFRRTTSSHSAVLVSDCRLSSKLSIQLSVSLFSILLLPSLPTIASVHFLLVLFMSSNRFLKSPDLLFDKHISFSSDVSFDLALFACAPFPLFLFFSSAIGLGFNISFG